MLNTFLFAKISFNSVNCLRILVNDSSLFVKNIEGYLKVLKAEN